MKEREGAGQIERDREAGSVLAGKGLPAVATISFLHTHSPFSISISLLRDMQGRNGMTPIYGRGFPGRTHTMGGGRTNLTEASLMGDQQMYDVRSRLLIILLREMQGMRDGMTPI